LALPVAVTPVGAAGTARGGAAVVAVTWVEAALSPTLLAAVTMK